MRPNGDRCRIRDCRLQATYVVRLVLADEVAATVVVCEYHAQEVMVMRWGLSIEALPRE